MTEFFGIIGIISFVGESNENVQILPSLKLNREYHSSIVIVDEPKV